MATDCTLKLLQKRAWNPTPFSGQFLDCCLGLNSHTGGHAIQGLEIRRQGLRSVDGCEARQNFSGDVPL
eukprot:scaffold556762_cov50-Prasinocladus_malaysianus.AAC.1